MSKEFQPQDLGAIYKAKGIAGVERTKTFQDIKAEKGFVLIPADVPGKFEIPAQERSVRQPDKADKRFTLLAILGESERYINGIFTLPGGREVPGIGAKILYCIEKEERSYEEIAFLVSQDKDLEKAKRIISAFISQFNTKDKDQGIKIVRSRKNKQTFAKLTFPEIEAAKLQQLNENEQTASDVLTKSDIEIISAAMLNNWDKIRTSLEGLKLLDGLKDVVDQEALERLMRSSEYAEEMSFEAQRKFAVKHLGLIFKHYHGSLINKLVSDVRRKDSDLASLISSIYHLREKGVDVVDLMFDQNSSDVLQEEKIVEEIVEEEATTAIEDVVSKPARIFQRGIKIPESAKGQGNTILLPEDMDDMIELFSHVALEDLHKIIDKVNQFNENPSSMLRPVGRRTEKGLSIFEYRVLNKYCMTVVALGRQKYEVLEINTIENAKSHRKRIGRRS